LQRGLVGKALLVSAGGKSMAIDAVHVRRSGEESHRVEERIYGKPFEQPDIFVNVVGHLSRRHGLNGARALLRCGLAECQRSTQARQDYTFNQTQNRSPPSEGRSMMPVILHYDSV